MRCDARLVISKYFLSNLILEELEVITSLLDFLSKSILKSSDFLWVIHLKMEVDAKIIQFQKLVHYLGKV